VIQVNQVALLSLRWTLGVALFIEAALLAFSRSEIHLPGHAGMPHWIHLVIAAAEMLACVLLVIPLTVRFGTKLLIGVVMLAALIHILHGSFQIGPLLIYASAAWVVLTAIPGTTSAANHE
jgi:uncharacterized membrane protein YphA (DoxX/SURF4 family)